MKYKRTDHWTDKPNQIGLLFFCQILDEALFDYTLDSYKPQALNIRLLCIECLQTIDNVKEGVIKKPNLKSIIEELLWSLEKDYAAKRILGNKHGLIISKIKQVENDFVELKATIIYLYHYFDDRKYLIYLQNYLNELIPQNIEKKHIYQLSKIYLTELMNYGYLPGYIYYKVNSYFFDKVNPVTINTPAKFFELFNFEENKFTVIFRADKVFNEFNSIANLLKFQITNIYQNANLTGKEKDFINSKPADELFIIFNEIPATDELSARLNAEIPLERIGNMFSFFHHKEKPKINSFALVVNGVTNIPLLIEKPIKSIIKKEDIKPKQAVDKVKNVFEKVDLPLETIVRISKAIDIHSIALETDEIENKLLNLWTSIESLLPKNIECGHDRIVQIYQALVPFQCIHYINNILNQVSKDFFYYNPRLASTTLRQIVTKQPESKRDKVAALLFTKENEANRQTVYASLSDYPLLRWRIFSINKNFTTGKSITSFLNNHIKKVEWQIQRIYRVRNLIVHSGIMPSYTNILVENLHNYYDNLLNYILDSKNDKASIKSIKEGVIACDIKLKILLENLKVIGENEIDLDNFKNIYE